MTVDVSLDHMAWVVSVKFLHCFFSPFPYCTLCKEVAPCSPHLKGNYVPSPWGQGIFKINWNSSINVHSPCSFIHSFIYRRMDSCHLYYTSGYNPWLFIFVSSNFPFLAIESSFNWFLYPFHILRQYNLVSTFYFQTLDFRVILYIPCSSSRICHFSMKTWLTLLKTDVRNQDLCARCAHLY